MKRTFLPDDHDDRDLYKLLIGLVVPRPIAWVGTRGSDGVDNLAPFSFFTAVAASPPTVVFSTIRPDGRRKDTLRNIEATGCFTVSVVTEDVVEAMNVTSGRYPPEVDEFAEAGLRSVDGDVVDAPMVAEARAGMEARLDRLIPIGDDRPMAATLVLGEIVAIHVDDELLTGTRVDQEGLRAVGRMGGPLYTRTTDRFSLDRPD